MNDSRRIYRTSDSIRLKARDSVRIIQKRIERLSFRELKSIWLLYAAMAGLCYLVYAILV